MAYKGFLTCSAYRLITNSTENNFLNANLLQVAVKKYGKIFIDQICGDGAT